MTMSTQRQTAARANSFDVAAARRRCLKFRRRILDLSQKVSAMHIAPVVESGDMSTRCAPMFIETLF